MYLNGSSVQQQQSPRKEVSVAMPKYGQGWSIARPNDILKLTEFGEFGMAHLAQWQRELTAVEIKTAFFETIILEDKEKIIKTLTTRELICCEHSLSFPALMHARLFYVAEQPTRKAQVNPSQHGARSSGVMFTLQHSLIAACWLLFSSLL